MSGMSPCCGPRPGASRHLPVPFPGAVSGGTVRPRGAEEPAQPAAGLLAAGLARDGRPSASPLATGQVARVEPAR